MPCARILRPKEGLPSKCVAVAHALTAATIDIAIAILKPSPIAHLGTANHGCANLRSHPSSLHLSLRRNRLGNRETERGGGEKHEGSDRRRSKVERNHDGLGMDLGGTWDGPGRDLE